MTKSFTSNFDKDVIEGLAKESGFVKRKSTIDGSRFLELLMFNSQQGNLSTLNELTEDFEMKSGCRISKQGLDERFNEQGVSFLKSVLNRSLDNRFQNLIQGDAHFSSCCIRDSTRFALPDEYATVYKGHGGATNTHAMISIQHEVDLLSGRQLDLQLTSGRRNDQQDSRESCPNIEKNSLSIRDLGYVTTYYLKQVVDREAYFLNRLPAQIHVFDRNKNLEKVDFERLEKKIKRYHLPYMELEVLVGKKAKIPCRLIVYPANDKTAKSQLKRTTKHTKSIGCKVSKDQKVKSRLSIYITNVDRKVIKAQDVASLYSLRWQIELIFKSWKSFCNIDKIKKVKMHRFECMLIAGLIWILANWRIFQCINDWFNSFKPDKSISVLKFFKHVSKHAQMLREIIFNNKEVKSRLDKLLKLAENKFVRESKKGRNSYSDNLNLLKLPLA